MSWSTKYKKSINCNNPKGFSQKAHCAGKKKNESMEFEEISEEILDEKLIVYNNRKKYGQVVFIAGGAGSGKGFAISNFLDSATYKIRDVDEMKKQLQILNRLGKLSIDSIIKKYSKNIKPKDLDLINKIQDEGFKLQNLNLKNPNHVYALHILVKAIGIKDTSLEKMLLGKENPNVLPNILFDITAKDVTDITNVIPMLKKVGYKSNNIHLTWILTNYEVSLENNKNRSRKVPDGEMGEENIMLKTHEGASNTIWGLLTKALPKGMNGRADVILNNPSLTVFMKGSDGKEIEKTQKNVSVSTDVTKDGTRKSTRTEKDTKVKFPIGFEYLKIKKEGGSIISEKEWKKKLFGWIKNNAPESITANMKESTNESVTENRFANKPEVTPKQLLNIQADVRKINRKIKVYISKHPITKGQLNIELGHGHDNDAELDKIYKVLKKRTGDWRTGSMFNESINEQADYKYLTQVILDAKPKYDVHYNSSHNVVNIGGVGYDKGDLVKNFNQKPGSSTKIKNNFYHAHQDPQKTKREVEKLSKGKIKVKIEKNPSFVSYSLSESVNEAKDNLYLQLHKKYAKQIKGLKAKKIKKLTDLVSVQRWSMEEREDYFGMDSKKKKELSKEYDTERKLFKKYIGGNYSVMLPKGTETLAENNETMNEGKKRFYQQDGIGRAKYTISYHDGKSKHKDGSDFYGIQILKNKKELEKFRSELLKKGYREDSGFKKESVNENYKGNFSDFKYEFGMALDNIGISPKAIKKISKKGKGFEVRMSSYMSDKSAWEKLGKAMGANLVDFKKGTINIGLYESVNEESFTATSKKSGETAVFKSKDNRDAAVKAGTHSKIDDKEDDSKPKGKSVFSKDSGYDAPDLKKPTSKGEPKTDEPKNDGPKIDLDLSYEYADDIEGEVEKLEGKISDEDYKKIETKLEDLRYAQQDFEESESYDSPEEAEENGVRIYTQNDIDKISGDLKDMIRQSNGTPKAEPKVEPKKVEPKSEPKRVPLDKNDSYYIKTAVEREMGPEAFKALSYGDMQKAYDDEMESRGWEQDDKGNWTKPANESVNERYSDFIKAKNLTDIVALSKKKKNATFYVTDDNNSRIGTFYLKNGKFAKATTANANYDLQNSKTSLKDRSDVIYKYKVDESINELNEDLSMKIGKVVSITKYNPKTNRKESVDVKITNYIKKPGSKDFVEYELKGKKRKISIDVFKSIMESIEEAKLSTIHKAAKKGSYPVSLVVIKDGKVIKQVLNIKTPQAVPAVFNVVKNYHKHKDATVHIEDSTGKRLFSEATFRPNSGTMSGGSYGLDKRKYELKRDVKGVQIGDYTNVTLPKGTIIYNLPGGVFAHHRSLKSYEAGMNKYFNKPTFRGISIRREKNVILSIEKNSKILESVNEAELKLGVKYVNKKGKEGFIQTGGSKNSQDWFWFDGKVKHPYDKVKKELKPSKDQKKTGFSDYLKQGGRVWDNVNKDGESVNEKINPKFYDARVQWIDPKSKKKFVGDVVRYDNGEYKVNLGKDGRFEKYILAKEKDLKIVSKSKKKTFESIDEGMMSLIDAIRQDSKDVRDFVSNVFKDSEFKKMKNDKDFIKYLKSIYEGVDESAKVKSLEEKINLFVEENVPTDPSKWSYYKSQAKKKFDVYPSAYANGWAAKKYKAAGGGWKKEK